ncbi:rod shape-determining protein MreC [Candidatus Parcubacteria bacterium]|nr:MAG: rod shape-determining protein MreC [Candidatus Parcubacteria bacterium]
MTKSFKLKSSKTLWSFWNTLFIVLVIIVVFVVGFYFKDFLVRPGVALILPINHLTDWFANLIYAFGSINKSSQTVQELNSLRGEVGQLEARLISLESENNFLKSQLGLNESLKFVPMVASVIANDSIGFIDFGILNVGSNNGIQKNMNVLGENQILIGRVGETYNKTSQMIFLSDPLSKVSAKTESASGIVIGRLHGGLIFDFVPKNQSLKEGDVVISSGLDGIFIQGLPIGRVKQVINIDSEIYQQAVIEPFIDYTSVGSVLIIEGVQ